MCREIERQRAALNGRFIVTSSPCGYREFHMIKPLLPDRVPAQRGGVTSP